MEDADEGQKELANKLGGRNRGEATVEKKYFPKNVAFFLTVREKPKVKYSQSKI